MKNKHKVGGVIIIIFLGIMGYLFTQSNIGYERDFTEVMQKDKTVRASGSWIQEKEYDIDQQSRTFTFHLRDEFGNEMRVVYSGTMPNNFESATSIVVTGKYHDGSFYANDILTKCPSKYQERQKTAANS